MSTERRICWPSFDCTCLEGGCGYCNMSPFRKVSTIERAVNAGKGNPTNRGNGSPGDLQRSLEYGKRHSFNNAETREKS